MKKTLTLLVMLLISMGAMAQVTDNRLLKWIEKLNEIYYIDNGICIAQQARMTATTEDTKREIKNKYSDCQIKDNGDIMVISGQLKKVRSDVYEDLNELIYRPQYTIEIALSDSIITTIICVNALISEMPAFNDNAMTNIYPINENLTRNGEDGNKSRKIMTNEGYIFCRTIEAMQKELNALNNNINLTDVMSVNKPDVITTKELHTEDNTYLSLSSMEHQIKKYANMSLAGETIMIGGAVIAAGSAIYSANRMSKNPEEYVNGKNGNTGVIIGGVVCLGGYIVKLCAYSELKKIQIQGSSVVYKF